MRFRFSDKSSLEAFDCFLEPSKQTFFFLGGVLFEERERQTAIDGVNILAEVGARAADPFLHDFCLCRIAVNDKRDILCQPLVQAVAESS